MSHVLERWGGEGKEIWKIVPPLSLTYFAQYATALTNLLVVARLGEMQLAVVAVVSAAFSIVFLISVGLISVATSVTAQQIGAGDRQGIRAAIAATLIIVVLCFVIFGIPLVFVDRLLYIFGYDSKIVVAALSYSRVYALSLLPLLLYVGLRGLLAASGSVARLSGLMIASVPLNLLFNIVLVLGVGPFQGVGLIGSAWASLATRTFVVLVALIVYRRHGTLSLLWKERSAHHADVRVLAAILRLGVPAALRVGLSEGMVPLTAMLAGTFGASSLVAHTMAGRVVGFASNVWLAFSGAAAVRVGIAFGAKDLARARTVFTLCLFAVFVIGLVLGPLVLEARFQISEAFAGHHESVSAPTLEIFYKLLPVAVVYQLAVGLQYVSMAALQGLSDTRTSMLLTISCNWLLGLAAALVLIHWAGLGILGLWLGLTIGSAVALVFALGKLSHRLPMPARRISYFRVADAPEDSA